MKGAPPPREAWAGPLVGLAWACALLAFAVPLTNPDLFWHLSDARRMLETGGVPRADWLSWTREGAPWIAPEWLYELAIGAAHRAAGMAGLLLLKWLALAATAWCVWTTTALYGASRAARAVALLAFALGLGFSNDLRPENLGLLLFSLEWLALERRRLGASPAGFPGPAAGAAFFALWANLHPGFPYGLVLLGVHAAAEARADRRWDLARTAAAAALGTLANPYGWGLYGLVAEHALRLGEFSRYINEWLPPRPLDPGMAPFWATLAAAAAAFLAARLRGRRVPAAHAAAAAFFAWSACRHARTVAYFQILGVTLAACHGEALLPARARAPLLGGAAAALLLLFAARVAPLAASGRAFLPLHVPERLTAFLERERSTLGGRRMLNPWHWGGYLGWKLAGSYKVFMDGRYIFHPFLPELARAAETPETYGEFLDARGIEVALVRHWRRPERSSLVLPGGRRVELERPFHVRYLPVSDWALVYWDEQGSVFLRRSAFPEDWVRPREFRLLRPDDLEAAELQVRAGAATASLAAEEVERWLGLTAAGPSEAAFWRAWAAGLRASPHP